ncbi:recombination-related endonuclease [Cyanophage S-RIM44]|uniref:Recombination-related endonuclease n=2 Tax=Vellamovirus TaxID=2733139 RepID=A0A1D7SFU6_9CAUD|nr:SbcC-like subunit of palindrome specific endonuclease [Prochlorococcus phage Syn1]YP_009783278.1 SbcC-like subunit of palindrome specific endonuclease [Cyanophage S-RIM44]ADO99236.1 recombination endonuclease subunit [Prochlorococcus phage Syn1]AOO11622.1 recombination-related endonuclease [Cyanophage S-RIM44]AOO11850.1 recombination-related endonuclease [Cyanophage S-RIM44]AOO12087.1 recombination-related endonuclease [Cyanophage S-RIM44]AOO12323.1 recombination-related endonuclease [Cyan
MIIFKTIRWKNFLSTGNVFTEVDLTTCKTNLIVGENGAGKSTILDALTFSLFGKPFRKINKPMLVNSINEKDCVTEIEFSIGKNEFKVVRGIKPNKFEIYNNGQVWNQESTLVDQQKNFEQNVLKMNYKSFTQIVVLGSSTFVPFMRLPIAQRREIIEDILDIQIFSTMNVLLKDKIRDNREEIKDFDYQVDLIKEKVSIQKSHLLELDKKNKADISKKEEKISELLKDENKQHVFIKETSDVIEKLNEQIDEYSTSSNKLKKLNTFLIKLSSKLQTCQKEHQFFEKNHVCPTCTQDLSDEFRTDKISSGKTKLDELTVGYNDILSAIGEEENRFNKWNELSTEITSNNQQISQANFQINQIRKSIVDVEKDIKDLESGGGDKKHAFTKLETLVEEKKELNLQLSESKKDKDMLSVAAGLLKDNGIKTRIIKKYLPVMNKLINQYLQGMDFYVNFTLDENFEETIKSRFRDQFSYASFSEGEKSRIDIALLLTWRSIAKLKNSVDTNLLILDEIFDGSLDQQGGSDLGWILRNFDDSISVFVISHKEQMNDKYDRTLNVEKVKNYSVVRETISKLD